MKRWTRGHPVTLILDTFRVDGTIHTEREEERFQDMWNELLHGRRDYIPVTHAVVSGPDGTKLTTEAFMLVPKRDIQAAFPRAETTGERSMPRVHRAHVRVTVILQALALDGNVHLDPDKPTVADRWESLVKDRRAFLPMTDVTLRSHAGESRGACGFLLVDKQDVLGAYVGTLDEQAPRRSDVAPVRASVLLDPVRVDGTLLLPRGKPTFDRFSDRWDELLRDYRSFVRVFDATLTTMGGHGGRTPASLVMVEKTAIRGVLAAE